MWLVLCASTDPSALWAYEGLVARGLKPVELVTAEVLAYSLRWEHRLSVRGSSIDITLADGRRINGDGTKGVLNRLQWAPSEHLMAAAPEERQYASQEIYAFLMGWLYSLPQPVLNRPTPQGLSGPYC